MSNARTMTTPIQAPISQPRLLRSSATCKLSVVKVQPESTCHRRRVFRPAVAPTKKRTVGERSSFRFKTIALGRGQWSSCAPYRAGRVVSSLSTPWPGTDVLSRSICLGSLVTPEPVVAGGVERSGIPRVFPLSEPADGSVGDGVVGLTLGPDWFAGAGALCANATVGVAAIRVMMANLRSGIF
jgi:hypothetical protein